MVAYDYRIPAGIPGELQRLWAGTTIEPNAMESPYVPAYGVGVTMDETTGYVRAVQAGDTAIYGFSVRPYPIQASAASGGFGQQPLGTPVAPPQEGALDVLRRGYISVLLGGTAAAKKGAPVYLWVAASTGTHVQGEVEAAATSGSTILLPATTFMGPADSNGNVEIAYNI